VHVGAPPDDDSRTDVADHPGGEDDAVDDREDRQLDGRSTAHAEVSLEVRRHVEQLGQVQRRRVVHVTG